MNFETTLIFSVTQFTNVFRNTLEKSLRELNLYSGQIYILILLWQEDAQTQISLAQKLNLSPPTVHKMVKSLSENNFVSCNRCANDSRMMRVHLTEKGVSIRSSVERQWSELENKVFASLTETEKLIFQQLVEKLKADLIVRS